MNLYRKKNLQLQKDEERLLQNNHHLLDEIERLKEKMERRERHHKHKRCLAMAERCKFRMYYLSAVIDYESSKLIPNPTAIKRYTKKESRMDYWKNRWLELAEKFKEEA